MTVFPQLRAFADACGRRTLVPRWPHRRSASLSQKLPPAELRSHPDPTTGLACQLGVQMIDCALHDLAHFSLSDMRIFRFSVACGAGPSGVDVFDWSIAKSHRYPSLGLSGYSGHILGRRCGLFHTQALCQVQNCGSHSGILTLVFHASAIVSASSGISFPSLSASPGGNLCQLLFAVSN